MLRVLLCITCCSAPPARRPSKVVNRANLENKLESKPAEKVDFKSLITLGQDVAKDLTLSDDELITTATSKPELLESTPTLKDSGSQVNLERQDRLTEASNVLSRGLREVSKLVDAVEDSFTASTSTSNQTQQTSSTSGTIRAFASRVTDSLKQQTEQLIYGDNESISSVDAAPYREDPEGKETEEYAGQEQEQDQQLDDKHSDAGTLEIRARNRVNIPSTTKIGDYARIEYSPVDDLDSLTTFSQSRGGSERGVWLARSSVSRSSSLGRQFSLSRASSANISRSSSRGIESTSISNVSQLSNENSHQNLTNILETANSPTPALFGTIGLPLGPPLDGNLSETARTSPETTGAALTSASQDSLSETSLNDLGKSDIPIASRSATLDSTATSGAALVVESPPERSYTVEPTSSNILGLPTGPVVNLIESIESTITKVASETLERIESPQLSLLSGLTNPTPTPSEMSGGSQKKKLKLKPKSLLKKLKPGSSKKKVKDEVSQQ